MNGQQIASAVAKTEKMKAVITVYCANGLNKIECSSFDELNKITEKFDSRGTDYDVDFVKE